MSQPDPTGESPVTTAKPLARYGAVEGARASGFAIPELHHRAGHDPSTRVRGGQKRPRSPRETAS